MKERLKSIDAKIRRWIDGLKIASGQKNTTTPSTVLKNASVREVLGVIKRYDFDVNYRATSSKPTLAYRITNGVYSTVFRIAFRSVKLLKGWLR